jgi:hypothetical protein
MKPRHAAALALVLMLSSCSSVQTAPSKTKTASGPDLEYEECLRTSDYPSECANEKYLRNLFGGQRNLSGLFVGQL